MAGKWHTRTGGISLSPAARCGHGCLRDLLFETPMCSDATLDVCVASCGAAEVVTSSCSSFSVISRCSSAVRWDPAIFLDGFVEFSWADTSSPRSISVFSWLSCLATYLVSPISACQAATPTSAVNQTQVRRGMNEMEHPSALSYPDFELWFKGSLTDCLHFLSCGFIYLQHFCHRGSENIKQGL